MGNNPSVNYAEIIFFPKKAYKYYGNPSENRHVHIDNFDKDSLIYPSKEGHFIEGAGGRGDRLYPETDSVLLIKKLINFGKINCLTRLIFISDDQFFYLFSAHTILTPINYTERNIIPKNFQLYSHDSNLLVG